MESRAVKRMIEYEPKGVEQMLEVAFVHSKGQIDKIGRELDLCHEMAAIASQYLKPKGMV